MRLTIHNEDFEAYRDPDADPEDPNLSIYTNSVDQPKFINENKKALLTALPNSWMADYLRDAGYTIRNPEPEK